MQTSDTQSQPAGRPWPQMPPDESAFSVAAPEFAAQGTAPQPAHYQYRAAQRTAALVNALGWFSIGIGLFELLAPRKVAAGTGTGGSAGMVRACGARELACGVGLLSGRGTSNWLWARVAGDALDLALLGNAARRDGAQRGPLAIAAAGVAGIAALDVIAARQSRRLEQAGGIEGAAGAIYVESSIAVNRSPEECYRFWHDFERFPQFMQHLESVQKLSPTRSHWVAKGPAGSSVAWDADIVADEPDRLIAWRSAQGADVDNAGVVYFERAPGGRGTLVRVQLQYNPPGGTAGALAAKLFGEAPQQQIDDDLRHFRELIEAGEIPTTVGQPAGPRSMLVRMLRKGEPG